MTSMTPLRRAYLVLAILGGLAPLTRFWFAAPGTGIERPWHWLSAAMGAGLGADLLIVTLGLAVWAVAETRVRRNWAALWVLPVTALLGPGCGLPLYLFLRTRPVV